VKGVENHPFSNKHPIDSQNARDLMIALIESARIHAEMMAPELYPDYPAEKPYAKSMERDSG
jgi:hypothetical protein